MESRSPIAPLAPHRGRHAGVTALGLLGSATVVAWVTRTHDPTADVPLPTRPAVATQLTAPEVAPIRIDESVKLAPVTERSIPYVVTASGQVTFDEGRTHHVRSPVAGVFVKTRPASLGRIARAGETVGVVYSVEVWVATTELLAQLRDFHGQEDLDAARMRLLRWGMRWEQVASIEKAGRPSAALPVIARVTGKVVVEESPGTARMLVDADMADLMTITDPASAWVYVEVSTQDAALLRVGGQAKVSIDGQPPFTAPIAYLASRPVAGNTTLGVGLRPYRGKMPPAATAKLELARTTLTGAAIPRAAVVENGKRTLVYVVHGDVAEPRDVQLGYTAEDVVLVVDGVKVGDRVVIPN